MKEIINGQVYEAPYPLCHTVIVQYLGEKNLYVLLSHPSEATHGGTCMIVCHYERKDRKGKSYDPVYTQKELQEKLKDWELTTDKLLLINEKVYPEHYQ